MVAGRQHEIHMCLKLKVLLSALSVWYGLGITNGVVWYEGMNVCLYMDMGTLKGWHVKT